MKNLYNIYLVGSLLILALFASCDQDNINAEYKETAGVTFSSSALTKATVQPDKPDFTVDLFRGTTSGELSGTVQFKAYFASTKEDEPDVPLEGVTVSGFSFSDGESMTSITVNLEPLEIGKDLTVELSISEADASPTGTPKTKLLANKDYNWQSLGMGTYVDNWASGVPYDVEILKAENFDRYRVMEPYTETLKNDDGEWEDQIANSVPPYVEFWNGEGDLVIFASFFMGLNYQAVMSQPIWAHHPSRFVGQPIEFNKWLDDKTVQLAPMYYIDDLGGFNYTATNGVIIIELP